MISRVNPKHLKMQKNMTCTMHMSYLRSQRQYFSKICVIAYPFLRDYSNKQLYHVPVLIKCQFLFQSAQSFTNDAAVFFGVCHTSPINFLNRELKDLMCMYIYNENELAAAPFVHVNDGK